MIETLTAMIVRGASRQFRALGRNRAGKPEFLEPMHLDGSAEIETLHELTTIVFKKTRLPAALNPLGNDGQIEVAGDGDNGFDNRGVMVIGENPVDKGPVDLYFVDRQIFQITNSTFAGTHSK